MKISSCEVYIESWGPVSFPTGHSLGSVAVDRNQARDIALFLNISGLNGEEQIICSLSTLTDLDSSQVHRGSLSFRFAYPQILVQITSSFIKGLLGLEGLVSKLTSAKNIGKNVRFRPGHTVGKITVSESIVLPERRVKPQLYAEAESTPPSAQIEPRLMMEEKMNIESLPEICVPHDENPHREIENLRKALEQECNRRKQLQEKAQHIEQENSYLNIQIKMEYKAKAEIQQKCSSLKSQFSELNHKLLQKEAELQKRTEELIHARSNQEDAMEEEIQQLRDVERVTNKARAKQNKLLSVLSNIMFSRAKTKSLRAYFANWKISVRSISKRLTFLKLVSKHCFFHSVGKFLFLWRDHVDKLNNLRGDLDRFLFTTCKAFVRRVFYLWFRSALLGAKSSFEAKAHELEASCMRLSTKEKELVEQIDSTLELMEAADSKNSRKQEELKGVIMQLRLELQSLESRLMEAHADRHQLEQRLVDFDKNVTLLGETRSRSLQAEEAAKRLAAELQIARDEQKHSLKIQEQMESTITSLESRLAVQDRRTEELEDRITEAEAECAQCAAQGEVCSQQLAKAQADLTVEMDARAALEELGQQREKELAAARGQAQDVVVLKEIVDDEKARRRAVEDALGKLVTAFKEQKLSLRRRQHNTVHRLFISKFFYGWIRASCNSTRERAADRVRAVEKKCETQQAALDEEGVALRSCMQQLTDMRLAAEAGAAREEALESACEKAEKQLAELKARYLEGVKSSVQTIRLCRDRYLAASPVVPPHPWGGGGDGAETDND